MASPVYQAMGTATGGSGDTVTITAPASIADNDILIATVYAEPETQAISGPAGFASFARVERTGAEAHAMELFWKRAASESGNYAFTETGNAWGDGTIARISGCVTTETPIGAVGTDNSGTLSPTTANGLTTLTDASLLCYVHTVFDGQNTLTVPTGMTQRYDNDNEYLATEDRATAGATGDRQAVINPDDWCAVLFELKSVAVGGATAWGPLLALHNNRLVQVP